MFRLTATALLLLLPCAAAAGELAVTVVGEDDQPVWARFEVRGPDGKMHQPPDALRDRTASNRASGEPWYVGSFVARGPQRLDLEPGRYTLVVDKGPEFKGYEEVLEIAAEPVERIVRLERWIDMNELGWYSADFHIHRPTHDMPALLQAEDLNLGVVQTTWNQRNLWDRYKWPANPIERVTPEHVYTLTNAEDERGGGAFMLHMLRQEINFKGVKQRWYPPGLDFIEQAKQQRYIPEGFPWIELEKPFWWEAPVVMALARPDSIGLLHNHFNQYGILDNEAWGRPRDHGGYPDRQGFANHTMDLIYRYWNLGFDIPVTAGSASGVLPNPVGYNRTYVELNEPFDVEPFYRGLRQNRSFVTNGPMLFFDALEMPGRRVSVAIDVRSEQPLDRIELIANGIVIETFAAPPGKTRFETQVSLREGLYTWVAARAFARNESTIRMAHSQAVRLNGYWSTTSDAQYFVEWIEELIEQTEADADRFETEKQKEEVLATYRRALAFYQGLL